MSDGALRFAVTLGLLATFIGLEFLRPARPNALTFTRFGRHALIAIMGALASRLILGSGLVGIAVLAQDHGVGVFNWLSVPAWVAILVCFIAMDFAIWAQHLVLHKVPWLWRLHRVHHGDTIMDVSTALRFHPFEILASLAFKAAIIIVLGAPAVAVLAFEIALGAGALFTHANIALPTWLERSLRFALITPSLHVIHHSPNPLETNSNYGFSFSVWDRIFGTYRATRLVSNGPIGLENWREPCDQTLPAMLANPFK